MGLSMDLILYEDDIKYGSWAKIALIFPIVLLIAMGLFFYVDAHYKDLLPKEPAKDSNIGALILFASAPFVLFVYWMVLPRKIFILQDRIRLQFGQFFWNVPFKTVESVKASRGIAVWSYCSSITCYSTQIEIVRKNRGNIRVSPARRDQFLDYVNRAISDWKRTHGNNSRNWGQS
jgi:hypothetical protein